MPFDARAAKLLQAGEHIILPEHPGLRLVATPSRRSWIYRYKSPVDGGMRQVKLGEWPGMGYPAAAVLWEKLRAEREQGADPALQKRAAKRQARAAEAVGKELPYRVADLVQDYLAGHINLHRKPKGRAEVRRLLEQNLAPIGERPAHLLLRSEAYDLLQGLSDRPVLMGQVRQEMGGATIALRDHKISVAQAKSYRNMLVTAGEALHDANTELERCRKETGSTSATSPDPCWLTIRDVVNIALENIGSIRKAIPQ